MANPFRKFRKYQKRWLAGLGILVMISFVVLPVWMDTMSSNPTRDPVVVSTTRYGDLHEMQLQRLKTDRLVLKGFFEHLAQSAMEAGGDGRGLMTVAQILGSGGEEEVVETWLMTNRAEELGIMVSDEEINQFLNDLTGQQGITPETFHQVMRYRQISENYLFNMLRHELLANRLQQMFGISRGAVTPAQRWDYYQRLNEKARIEVAPLPVESFVGQVPDPDEATLLAFFEQHKSQLPHPASPEPGFREPQRIALEYFKANVDAVEVSDAEIKEYYEKNKDAEFVRETLPEVKKDAPAAEEEKKEEAKATEAKPTDEKPAKPEAEMEKPAPSEAKQPEKDAKQPEKDAKQPEKKTEAKEPAKKEAAGDKTSSVKSASPFRLAAYQQAEKKEETPKDGKPEAQPSEPAKKDIPKPAPPAEAPKEEAKKPAAEKKAEKTQDAKPAAEPSKYIPLENVKGQIRARLAEEKIRAIFSRVQDRMSQYQRELERYDIHRENKAKKDTLKAPEKPDFKKLAEENNLAFKVTPLISPLEVNELDIGRSFVGPRTPFVRYAFETLAKLRPETSQDIEGNHFLFWKTDQTAERVPEFTEPEIRERVLRVWKQVQARQLAEQKAKDLAAKAREANKPFKDVFANLSEKETGLPQKITVRESAPFSWMTYGAFPAWMAQAPPQISSITAVGAKDDKPGEETEIVEMPGNDFMRRVFHLEEDNAKIGVAMNQPKTVVYVFHVIDLTPAVWQAFLVEDFSRYARVAEQDQLSLAQAWRDNLKAEVGFKTLRPLERERRQSQ